MNKSKVGKISSRVYLGIVLALIYIPMLSMIIFSFNSSKTPIDWTGFTFKWYQELFTDPVVIEVVLNTFFVAIVSTIISTIIGTLAAISLTKNRKVFKDAVIGIGNIPIISPEIVTAVAFFLFFEALPIDNGYTKMILAHIAFSTPYVVLAVYPKVKDLDKDIVSAAYDLGATPRQALYKVIIPQIKVAIIAGAAIAFAMSFDDFIISFFVTGGMVQNISTYLYSFKRGIKPVINALSTIIILVIGAKIVYDYVKSGKKQVED